MMRFVPRHSTMKPRDNTRPHSILANPTNKHGYLIMKTWLLTLSKPSILIAVLTASSIAMQSQAESAEQIKAELDELPAELRQFTSVTGKDPKFRPSRPTIVSWSENLRILHDNNIKLEPARVARVENELSTQLSAKGYQIANDSKQTQYYLQAMAALGGSSEQESLGRIVGLSAGLGGHKVHLDKGSLALVIVDKNTRQMMWRSKVQIFTQDSLSVEIKNERLKMAVAELLSELPNI